MLRKIIVLTLFSLILAACSAGGNSTSDVEEPAVANTNTAENMPNDGTMPTDNEDMNNDDGLLQSRIAWDWEQIDWPWMTRQPAGNNSFRLPRPYTSKWVAKMARDSLLYWKCMGERMDGRTDQQYGDDIDFGPAHAGADDKAVCHAIGQWIDQGIQRDPD